jgi:hypothetical protein
MVGATGVVGDTATVIARLVGAAAARWAGAAMAARPVTGRRAGAEPKPSSPAVHLADGSGNWTRGDDFLRIVITFGTNAL